MSPNKGWKKPRSLFSLVRTISDSKNARIMITVLGSVFALGVIGSLEILPEEDSSRHPASGSTEEKRKFSVVLRDCDIVHRNELDAGSDSRKECKGGAEVATDVEIPELEGKKTFENEDLKVVLKKGTAAISINEKDPSLSDIENEDLKLKAATVFYHALRAKHFFQNTLKAKETENLPQVTIRLDIANNYFRLAHYKPEHDDPPVYNDALSIPAGKHFRPAPGDESEWGPEIWFRPRKAIPISEILAEMNQDPLDSDIKKIREVLYPFVTDTTIRNISVWLLNSKHENSMLFSGLRTSLGTLLLAEVGFKIIKGLNRLFIPQHYYIDAALVPEIIYHEFTHVALNTVVGIQASTPLNEGLADYFAARIANNPKLGARIRDYSTARFKNGKSKLTYDLQYEMLGNDSSDFVLSFLWNLGSAIGEDREMRVIYEARHFIDPYRSDIRGGLSLAMQLACSTECADPHADKRELDKYLIKYGFMKDIVPVSSRR